MEKEKLVLIPGPTPVHPRITQSLSLPTVSHVSPVFVRELKEALANLKKIVFCEKGEPFIIAGSGTLAMEMAVLNTIERGERFLILSQGYFGERMAGIARSFDLSFDIIGNEPGEAVSSEELAAKISGESYAAVVCTHVDTATGACAPVKDYAEVIKNQEVLFRFGDTAFGGPGLAVPTWPRLSGSSGRSENSRATSAKSRPVSRAACAASIRSRAPETSSPVSGSILFTKMYWKFTMRSPGISSPWPQEGLAERSAIVSVPKSPMQIPAVFIRPPPYLS